MARIAHVAVRRPLAGSILAVMLCAGASLWTALAQNAGSTNATPPDFSTNQTGWVQVGGEWTAMPGSPPPVTFDPAHPYVPNNTGRQPTFRVADLNNPNLTQFAKDALQKANDEVLAGKAMYSRSARCWATGVPAFLLSPAQPMFFIQTPKKVTIISQVDHQVRHVYLNVPHSANPKPSWYGESVGHYEGDTLVIDTIGQNTKTFVDNYRTPHSEKLHVVERYRRIENGNILHAEVTMEDPAVFIKPLHVFHRFRRVQGSLIEWRCAEGTQDFFDHDVEPIPTASAPDF